MEVRNGKIEKLNDDVLSENVGGLESWIPLNSTLIKSDQKDLVESDQKDKLIHYEKELD